jgi:acyl-coenzyme A thioesterase PaaI-like protein
VQRGRTICVCDVQVEDAGGRAVARALVTYKLDHT